MDTDRRSVFVLMTSLCEKLLDGHTKCKSGSNLKVAWMRKLRSKAYSILLSSPDHEFPDIPHECFVKLIAAIFDKGIQHDIPYFDEFDKCIEHLWQESSKKPYILSVIYFLAQLRNESQAMDIKDTAIDEDGNFDILGFTVGSLPKKYNLYHPSTFVLPDLQSSVARDAKRSYLSNPQKLPIHLNVQPPIYGLQFNTATPKNNVLAKGFGGRSFSPFPSITQDQHDVAAHQLEDEGYVSPGATPLGTGPGEWSSPPWYELVDLNFDINDKSCHLTWEALGEPKHALEHPPMTEAGIEALHCNIKIQECLLLTLDHRYPIQSKDAIHWKTLLHHVTYLLTGLESESFFFNEKFDRFELVAGVWVEGISSEALATSFADCIAMGTCFRRLSIFVETPRSVDCSEGIVQQAIRKSTSQYLHLYCGACLLMMHNLLKRTSFSILLMRLRLKGLQQQILGLARAFGKWGCGASIPKGVCALGHLYRHTSSTQRKDVASLLRQILHSACTAYFNLLERWVYNGEVADVGDFFVAPRSEYVSCCSRRYWTRAFSFNAAAVPEFLCGLEQFLLRCGKSVHFLKLCDQKNAVLEEGLSLSANLKSNHLTPKKEELVKSKISKESKPSDELSCSSSKSDFLKHQKNLSQTEDGKESEAVFEDTCGQPIETKSIIVVKKKPDESMGQKDALPHSSLQGDWNEVKMLESEKQKLIQHYGKLSQISEKKRLKAEWRARRMLVRIKDSSPAVPINKVEVSSDVGIVSPEDKSSEISGYGVPDSGLSAGTVEVVHPLVDECRAVDHEKIKQEEIPGKREIQKDDVNGLNKTEDRKKVIECVTFDQNLDNIDEHARIVDSKLAKDHEKVASQDSLECNKDTVEESLELPTTQKEIKSEKDVTSEEMVKCEELLYSEKELSQEDALSSASIPISTPKCGSPDITPLLKPGGLFPFSHTLPRTKKVKDEAIQDEAHPSDWPYRSVLVSLMIQSQKMDAALLRWMLVEKGLVSHLRSLRAYFFLLDGEFGRRLSEDLFSAMRRAPGGRPSVESLNVVALGSLLSHSLASSTFATSDPNASLLSLTLRKCTSQTSGMDALACVQMHYEAPWPLNVVLTEEAISKYSRVLDLLLRLKHASWALEDAFLHLRVIEPGKGIAEVVPRGCRTPHEAVHHSPQYHKLHLYRHQMLHLVRAVQTYISAGVLQASGKKLEEAIAHSSCLDEFYTEHVMYVKRILFGCLLNRRSETIANILNDILRLIMKFQWSLCSRSWFIPPDRGGKESCHLEHPNFNVLCRIFGAFEDMTDFLLKYAWRLASRGYQVHLFELLQMLNVNDFYRLDNGEDAGGKEHENYAVLSQ